MKVWILLAAFAAVALAGNPIEDLQEQIDSGAVHLEYRRPRGYLDSLLDALDISSPDTNLSLF